VDERITEKALYEIYFPHFKALAARARNGSVMCAYNQVNGVFSCNNKWMLDQLRSWGFDGTVVPDAIYALRTAEDAARAGVDNIQPAQLDALVKAGKVPVSTIDSIALHHFVPRFRLGIYDDKSRGDAEANVSTPEHVALARQVAAEGAVLLQNRNNVLPLASPAVKSIAVIGDDAGPNVTAMVGGSAHVYVDPARLKSPLDGIKSRAGSSIAVTYAKGTLGVGRLPALPADVLKTASGQPGFDAVYWTNGRFGGVPAFTRVDTAVDFVAPPPGIAPTAPPESAGASAQGNAAGAGRGGRGGGGVPHPPTWSAKWTGTFVPPSTGLYRFSIAGAGTGQLYVANRPVVALMRADFEVVAHGTIELTAGQPVPIALKYSSESNITSQILRLGWAPPEPALVNDAVAAAKISDVAIVFAGELVGEGYDKLTLSLPADQDWLINAVADANPRTVVVLHTSNPVAMPWLNKVAAVIEAWYPGQEAGTSIASVVFGDVNPAGRLPMTFPASESQAPATRWTQYPGDGYTVNFDEGVLVGYRWYDAYSQQPLFPFGFGLSYTTFKYDELQVRGGADGATVTVRLTNTGRRAGAEIAQMYVGFPAAAQEPPRQLKGFEKVSLKPGESRTVSFSLDRDALSAWDESIHGWKEHAGAYTVEVGRSSRDLALKGTFTIGSR
jgi:beta-glucosidase